jgi:uncharacterized protein (TIGR00730 family)
MTNENTGKPNYQSFSFKDMDESINERVSEIGEEFKEGFNFIKKYPRTVTIFGSARTPETESDYVLARELSKRISEELNYSVVTGGSYGIMEAGNRGAFENGGQSLGLNIELPHEQHVNKYLSDSMEFHYFFSRKVCLSFSAEAYVYFPGGFGTMDELFEILTLIQTHKIDKVPVILIGSYFWNSLDKFIKENLLKHSKISDGDTDLYKITDDLDEALTIIKNAPIRVGME